MRLAIVAAEFHREVTDRMVEKALARAKERGVQVTSVVRVPGTFEIPLAVQRLLERPDVDGAVAIGAVIKGETLHDEALMAVVPRALLDAGLRAGKPVSLAGTYLAGSFPKGVHVDTFGSMFAVLIGSAETVTSETRDVLDSVVIRSKASQYLIVHGGRKALLVMRLGLGNDPLKAKQAVEKYIPRIEEHL